MNRSPSAVCTSKIAQLRRALLVCLSAGKWGNSRVTASRDGENYLMKFIRQRVLTLSLALLALLGLQERADAFSYGVNLIVNGNAEAGSSSASGSPVSVPNWVTSPF